MATIEEGQIGAFRGKIGRVVVAPFRKITVGRSVPKKSSKPATEVQLAQRLKFGLINNFINGFGDILNVGFKNAKGNATPTHEAVRYHLYNAVKGAYPDYAIDFTAVKLSNMSGKLLDNIMPFTTTAAVNGKTTISWEAADGNRTESLPTDNLFVALYNETEQYFMNYRAAAKRSQLTVTLRTPHEEETDVIHAWVMYVSVDGKMVSKSKYLGVIAYA